MTPEEIILAPEREKPKDTKTTPPTPETPPKPISADELDELLKVKPITYSGNLRVIGDITHIADVNDVPLRVCCRCVRWDLTNANDRNAYASLVNRASEPESVVTIGWEERVVHEATMIVYLTYLEYVRIVEDQHA